MSEHSTSGPRPSRRQFGRRFGRDGRDDLRRARSGARWKSQRKTEHRGDWCRRTRRVEPRRRLLRKHRRCLRRVRAGPRPRAAHPKAEKFVDFRRLYDHAKKFDAVVVSTTEHTHAFATLPALQLGKHVYCEKPLTHKVYEARVIREAAAKAKVATQMGTQIHAGENYRRVVELVQTGAIGPVGEAHVWVGRAWGRQSDEDGQAKRRHRLTSSERPTAPSRCRPAWTGTSGSARAGPAVPRGVLSRARSGIAGGTSATAP